MRISLGGPIIRLDPIVVLFDTPGTFIFNKDNYPSYTNYETIVIGAGGGRGGLLSGEDPENIPDPPNFRNVVRYGGEGGGGGLHWVKGLLEVLDGDITVIVGDAGTPGTDTNTDDLGSGSDGGDGGSSLFGSIALATGGMGGRRSQSVSSIENSLADGGSGGVGGISEIIEIDGVKWAGALGGQQGMYDDGELPPPRREQSGSEPGQDGTLIQGPIQVWYTEVYTLPGLIGQGGGGGPGGTLIELGTLIPLSVTYERAFPSAESGGKGSYNSDESVFSPGTLAYGPVRGGHAYPAHPGKAGGGKITPLNSSRASYGDSGKSGVVAIRLTAE